MAYPSRWSRGRHWTCHWGEIIMSDTAGVVFFLTYKAS